MNFQWNREQKWNRVRVRTVYVRTFRRTQTCLKTKITRASCRRRTGTVVPQNSQWRKWIAKQSSICRGGTRFGTHSGYSHTRVKQKLPSRPRRAWWSSWSRRGNQKSFTLTIPWNLASLARNYPVIIVRQHHTDHKQMGLLREQCAEWKKVRLLFCCNQVWMRNGGRIPLSFIAICETFKISWLMGKHNIERRFGMPFNGPVIPFGATVEYHPISAKEQSRLHQFGAKVLPGLFLGYALYAGRIWKGDIMVADIEELEEMDASEAWWDP